MFRGYLDTYDFKMKKKKNDKRRLFMPLENCPVPKYQNSNSLLFSLYISRRGSRKKLLKFQPD